MKKTISLVLILLVVLFSFCACGFFGGSSSNSDYDNSSDSNDSGNQSPKSVLVTLDLNGGYGIDQLSYIGVVGSEMNLPTPTREGYVFNGWYNDWQIVDSTVFPQEDTVLTARYLLQNERSVEVSAETPLNEVYQCGAFLSVAHGEVGCGRDDFSDPQAINYLLRYPNTTIQATCCFEYYISSYSATFKWTGASSKDIIDKTTLSSSEAWKSVTFEQEIGANFLFGNNGATIMRLICDANLGSTYISMRNVKITLTFLEQQGVLV